jgi:antitoxin HigA-1
MADFAPTHLREILMTEFLEPVGIPQYRIAKAIDVAPRRISEILHGKRAITADTALRRSRSSV